ncbi:XdhC family protein [Flavobacterium hydrophilum]|uniref:XshC-Cox1-family protein n=1 Tax=Flavobacterium hydrophilum TaxID=2211445 RepID=A0A2V4C627_9FLAO|nr:XdhC/CoxI family protein [Flavobacterium hydrophilum]PXY46779.1 XshC-Cox1-family protein [Flavobacterium hydrophilum]
MMHELLKLKESYILAQKVGLKAVMATVVAIEGSSYRRPGVRMLIFENNTMVGAVSGGCVENEILKQSQSVFLNNKTKMMVYDGRYRLGCEGVLYILLEPFSPDIAALNAFETVVKKRQTLKIESFYTKTEGIQPGMGSEFHFEGRNFAFSNIQLDKTLPVYTQILKPRFHLIIIGSEHDAVQLGHFAFLTGWEVTIVASVKDPKTIANFPGANQVLHLLPEEIGSLSIDSETAVILMTHSYSTDLKFLIGLKNKNPAYLGLLGPVKRRNQLLNEFFEYADTYNEELIDVIHGPSGISIGAETPQEIAISIIAEILSVVRKEEPISLKYKVNAIHS